MDLPQELADDLPLTETTFFILLSLDSEPRHGYAIKKDVEAISHGRLVLSTGTLYGALRRLLNGGWIVRVDGDDVDQPNDERQRKYYRLTEAGRRVLDLEVARMKGMIQQASQHGAEAHS